MQGCFKGVEILNYLSEEHIKLRKLIIKKERDLNQLYDKVSKHMKKMSDFTHKSESKK